MNRSAPLATSRPCSGRHQVSGPFDGTGDELREECVERRVVDDRVLRLVDPAIRIDGPADRLKGVEGQTYRQYDVERRRIRAHAERSQQIARRTHEEVEVLEEGENAEIRGERQREPVPRSPGFGEPRDAEYRQRDRTHACGDRQRQPPVRRPHGGERGNCDGDQESRTLRQIARAHRSAGCPEGRGVVHRGGDRDENQEAGVPPAVEDIARDDEEDVPRRDVPPAQQVQRQESRQENCKDAAIEEHAWLLLRARQPAPA
jgi:hypothetical protein